MPQNPARVRFDPRAQPQELPSIMKLEGREKVVLAAIDPGGGYKRSGLETSPRLVVRPQRQLVDDEVNDVLGDVHRVGVQVVGVLVRDASHRGGRRYANQA